MQHVLLEVSFNHCYIKLLFISLLIAAMPLDVSRGTQGGEEEVEIPPKFSKILVSERKSKNNFLRETFFLGVISLLVSSQK